MFNLSKKVVIDEGIRKMGLFKVEEGENSGFWPKYLPLVCDLENRKLNKEIIVLYINITT